MPKLPIIKIINRKQPKDKKTSFQVFVPEVMERLKTALKDNEKTIIFINRRGLALSIICQECGFTFNCPNCDVPLVYRTEKEKTILTCHHCDYKENAPTSCPQCRGYKLKPLGIGTERIKKEIEKNLKIKNDYLNNHLFDLIESEIPDEKELEIIKNFNSNKIKILIGTEAIFRPQLSETDLAIIPAIDPMLFLPDYNSEEKTFFYLLKLKSLAKKELMIQTLNPENKIFDYLREEREKDFFEEEKKWRKKYFWPPYSHLIKLTFTHKNLTKGELEALKTKERILELIRKSIPGEKQSNFIVLGPAPAFISKEKGSYRWNILIKFICSENKPKANFYSPLYLSLLSPLLTKDELTLRNKILQAVPLNWKIDIEPKDTL